MPTNDEIKKLREVVRKRRAAVTAKENRIKRNTGIDIRGTTEDPRRPLEVINKYNRTQLVKYLADLNAFMSRSGGYVPGARQNAIPKAAWDEYKRLEKKYNQIGNTHFSEIADIFIPQAGMTINQRDQTLRPDSVNAQGDIVNRPYSPIDRKSTSVPDAAALNSLIKDLRKKTDKTYLPAKIKEARLQLNQMLTTIGNPDLVIKANKLSDRQFDVLWNYTNFATNVSGIYFIMQKQTASSEDRWYTSVVEDYSSDIGELFNWAADLPRS